MKTRYEIESIRRGKKKLRLTVILSSAFLLLLTATIAFTLIIGNMTAETVTTDPPEIKDGEDGQMPYQEYAYVMVCPSSGFASDEALSTAHYPNKDIILSIAHATTATQTTANIDHEIFENYDLDITENQAKAATVCLATIIPVIIVAWGFVVTYRRRHR